MPPKKQKNTTENVIEHVAPEIEVIPAGKFTKMESFLWQIRNICRDRGFQIWNSQQLVNQIYQDLLFIYHIPRLMAEEILTLDINAIGDGKLTEVSYTSLLTLKDPEHILASLRVLWSELQNSEIKDLFAGRSFILFDITKKENKKKKCLDLMIDIFKYISTIKLEKYDSNAGYTYFKKELNKGKAKTFGQFYTPPSVTYSVVKMVDPKIGETVLDPSCGSCSFLAEAANYMVKQENVEMSTAFTNLYGVELEPYIYAEGIMNMFINFGIMPNMKENIIEKDALIHLLKDPTTFSKIIANPPFGADAKEFKEWYFKTDLVPTKTGSSKMKKKIVENPEAYFKLPFPNTNESAILFFQLIILKLKKEGKAGVVMSATIFNDGFKDMMEWFLNCCSLEKIVINPAGTFKEQGTGIETFSFIFTKGKPTKTVEIVMLGTENNVVRTLTLDQIKEAGWKLQLKDEEKKVAYTGKYKLIPFDQLVTGKNGKNIPEEKRLENGLYPYYASNGVKGSVNDFNFEGPSVLIGDQGSSWARSIHYVTDGQKFYAGNHTIVLKANAEVNIRYIYYLLSLSNLSVFGKESAVIPEMNKELFYKSQQSNVPLPIQQEIVTNLDRIFADPQDMKDCLGFTDKAMDLMLKDPTGKQLEDVLGGLRDKRDCLNLCIRKKSQMAALVRSVGERGFERKHIKDVMNVVSGKANQDREVGRPVPYYDSNGVIGYVAEPLYTGEYTITARNLSIGAVHYINGPFYPSDHTINFTSLDQNVINNRFFYNWLHLNNQVLKELSSGIKPGIRKSDVAEILMPVPPIDFQHEVLAILNEMEAELQTLEQMAAKAEQRAKFILDGYLTPAPQAVEAEPVVDPNSIAAFIEKHIIHEDGAEVPFKKVAQKYKEWATARPEHKLLPLAELKPALSLVLGDLENEKYKGIKLI